MIAFADDNQKQDVMNIWRESFPDDSPQFTEMYFRKKYKKQNTLLYLIEDKIASCLQMLPYKMTFYNTVCKTSYISGAATLPEYKNQGIMGKLLTASFSKMRKRGDDFTTLIPQEPWLIGFYQKYGYTPCFEYNLYLLPIESSAMNYDYVAIEMNKSNAKYAFRYYSDYCRKQNLFVQKTYKDFLTIWEDLRLAGGTIVYCLYSNKVCGICFYTLKKGKVILKDLIVDSEIIKRRLTYIAEIRFMSDEIHLFKQSDDNCNSSTLGMARIINVDTVLEAYANYYPHLEITLKVSDNQIVENNGVFQIKEGKCVRSKDDNYDLSVDIAMLTQLVMGFQTDKLPPQYSAFPQQHPYMSLMLD